MTRALRLAAALAVMGAAPALAQDDRRPPLFVLSDDDSRVVLLGSVHVLPADALPLPPHVEAAYAGASVVAFELDLDLAHAGAAEMMRAAVDETPVAEALSAEQRPSLDSALVAVGLPTGAFDAFEPWFVGMTYSALALQRSGLDVAAGGVDGHLFGRAKADGKERYALETLALQTAVFDDLPTEAQVRFLLDAVELSPSRAAAYFGDLLAAWGSGDDDALAALLDDSLTQPDLHDALLVTRNRAWVPQIESLLAREGEDALVVVGAGHLVGEASVVAMLRDAGYTVERL